MHEGGATGEKEGRKKGIFEVSLEGGTRRYQKGNIEEEQEGEKASEKKNRRSSIDEA